MYFIIYQTTNKINNKIYIGKHQTSNLDDAYFGSGKHLLNSIKKYGIENFVKEILYVFDNEEEMNTKEKELVTLDFCLREDTYNICEGGKGGFGYINRTLSSEKRQVIFNKSKEKLIEKYGNEYSAELMKLAVQKKKWLRENDPKWAMKEKERCIKTLKESKSFLGKKHSEESKEKISQTMKLKTQGIGNSQFGTMWITDGIYNKKIDKNSEIPVGWKKGRIC